MKMFVGVVLMLGGTGAMIGKNDHYLFGLACIFIGSALVGQWLRDDEKKSAGTNGNRRGKH